MATALSMSGMPSLISVAELGPAFEADGEDFGPQLQVVDLDAVHLGHVHVVAGAGRA